MPHTETVTRTLYYFDELDDDAKERARDWFRQASADDEWWDATYEDAVQCAAIVGIEIATRGQKRMQPAIYFSGFSSQGDGACFEGSYSFKPDAVKAIRDHAPLDAELHAIADSLAALPYGASWHASVKHRGHYNHSGCMTIDAEWCGPFDGADDEEITEIPDDKFSAGEATIMQAMRDFADWIYSQLGKEDDYRNADEQVDDNIRANEYEFTKDGRRA